ncbi:hypothetical protein HQ563_04155 [bacterium]|nr:hypothetical protein [bacterium]
MNTFAAAQLMTNDAAYNSKPHIKEVTLPDGEQVVFHVMADTTMRLGVGRWTLGEKGRLTNAIVAQTFIRMLAAHDPLPAGQCAGPRSG